MPLEPSDANEETRMVPRLRHGAEPEPISDTLKTVKARWPRLAAKAETDGAGVESQFSEPQSGKEVPQTRAVEPQMAASEPQTGAAKSLSDKLFDLFGGGDNPSLRRALYIRCQLTCQTFGKPAELVLREVVAYARGARNPGNCFAFTIVRRFRENGFIEEV